jgi:hypothetical protein
MAFLPGSIFRGGTTLALPATHSFTAFSGDRMVAQGALPAILPAAHLHRETALLVFQDSTGRLVDLDLRGSLEDSIARLPSDLAPKPVRGRPKLGVTAREVTLLPRHWEWLASQPGGASAALRRLVDQARRDNGAADDIRQAQETTYRVMTTLAGDRPNYEEAVRALFANDRARFHDLISAWPADLSDYIGALSARADEPSR